MSALDRRYQGEPIPEDSLPSALIGLEYQHPADSFKLGPLMDGSHKWLSLDVDRFYCDKPREERGS